MIVKELKRKHNWPLLGRVWLCDAYLGLKAEWFTQCVSSCTVSRSHVIFSAFLSVNTEADIERRCKQVELHLKANYFGFDGCYEYGEQF